MSKITSRKDNALQVIFNDDSHIEYNNIFPKILSKNRKIAINVSLDRMVDRKDIVDNRDASFPIYKPVYSLVDKKVKVPSIGGRRNSQKRNQVFQTQGNQREVKVTTDGGNVVSYTFEDPLENKELRGLEKITMKKKLMKLDKVIQQNGEIRTKLQANGMPFVHDTREDDDLAKERYLIEATFKR